MSVCVCLSLFVGKKASLRALFPKRDQTLEAGSLLGSLLQCLSHGSLLGITYTHTVGLFTIHTHMWGCDYQS